MRSKTLKAFFIKKGSIINVWFKNGCHGTYFINSISWKDKIIKVLYITPYIEDPEKNILLMRQTINFENIKRITKEDKCFKFIYLMNLKQRCLQQIIFGV